MLRNLTGRKLQGVGEKYLLWSFITFIKHICRGLNKKE